VSRRTPPEPPRDCRRCPRLAAYRASNRAGHPEWHNGPVPAFGPLGARLLVVGLAPGLRGANRTGRPFTGDDAGRLLYGALVRLGMARGTYAGGAADGLRLVDCRITNALRCAPPANRPTGRELAACRGFLAAEIRAMPNLKAIVALGAIAHRAVVAVHGARQIDHPFGHGRDHAITDGVRLLDCYHCSRQNTSTGRLTQDMLDGVLAAAHALSVNSARA